MLGFILSVLLFSHMLPLVAMAEKAWGQAAGWKVVEFGGKVFKYPGQFLGSFGVSISILYLLVSPSPCELARSGLSDHGRDCNHIQRHHHLPDIVDALRDLIIEAIHVTSLCRE